MFTNMSLDELKKKVMEFDMQLTSIQGIQSNILSQLNQLTNLLDFDGFLTQATAAA